MGQEISVEQQKSEEFLKAFPSTYQLIRDHVQDKNLGEISIYQSKNKSDPQICRKSSELPADLNPENYTKEVLIPSLSIQDNKNIVSLKAFQGNAQNYSCVAATAVTLYLEYVSLRLINELENRRRKSILYTESELWIILHSLVSASSALKPLGLKLNDVRPSTIFLTRDGHIRMLPFPLLVDDIDVIEKYRLRKEQCLLAPEQLQYLAGGKQEIDPYKAEAFSIGMTLLWCGSLFDMRSLYDYQRNILDTQTLRGLKQKFRTKNSKFLSNLVNLLLETNPTARPSALVIMHILQPWTTEILNGQPFQPSYSKIKGQFKVAPENASLQELNEINMFLSAMPAKQPKPNLISNIDSTTSYIYSSQQPSMDQNAENVYSSSNQVLAATQQSYDEPDANQGQLTAQNLQEASQPQVEKARLLLAQEEKYIRQSLEIASSTQQESPLNYWSGDGPLLQIPSPSQFEPSIDPSLTENQSDSLLTGRLLETIIEQVEFDGDGPALDETTPNNDLSLIHHQKLTETRQDDNNTQGANSIPGNIQQENVNQQNHQEEMANSGILLLSEYQMSVSGIADSDSPEYMSPTWPCAVDSQDPDVHALAEKSNDPQAQQNALLWRRSHSEAIMEQEPARVQPKLTLYQNQDTPPAFLQNNAGEDFINEEIHEIKPQKISTRDLRNLLLSASNKSFNSNMTSFKEGS